MEEVFQIGVYEALKEKIGEDAAKLLIEYIELKKKEVATKEDIQRLEQSTKENIQRLEEIVRMVEKSTKEDIRRLENEINELRKEQRRNLYWILGVHIPLWVTTMGGIITLFLRMKP